MGLPNEELLRDQFGDLHTLLDEIESGQAHWAEFWPALEELRQEIRAGEDSLSTLVLKILERAEKYTRDGRIDQVHVALTAASAQYPWTP